MCQGTRINHGSSVIPRDPLLNDTPHYHHRCSNVDLYYNGTSESWTNDIGMVDDPYSTKSLLICMFL